MRIKDIPEIERPREKIARYEIGKLSDTELLAVILGSGNKKHNVLEISRRIIRKFGKRGLSKASFSDLKEFSGIGPARAAEIVACFELGKRFLKDKKAELFLSPRDIWKALDNLRDNKKEHFIIFFLDVRNQKIKKQVVSVGTIGASLVHPREVFEEAVLCGASRIILAHNHPSGCLDPSDDDLATTRRLIEAGQIMGIGIADHVIVCRDGYFSFKENNLLF